MKCCSTSNGSSTNKTNTGRMLAGEFKLGGNARQASSGGKSTSGRCMGKGDGGRRSRSVY